jgi:hypothetical protein
MMMTFGFASFYYLDKGLKANSTKSIIFGGVFAGLAALMHLIGLTLMVAGGLTLLFNKKLKYVLVFFSLFDFRAKHLLLRLVVEGGI